MPDIRELVERLRLKDWHDPACPFAKHCYCDDGSPHDKTTDADKLEAESRLLAMQEALEEAQAANRKRLALRGRCPNCRCGRCRQARTDNAAPNRSGGGDV